MLESPHEKSPPPKSILARVKNLRVEFDKTVAVRDLAFSLKSGSILGLIGPNGAGKTTALRTIAGILPPAAGRIEIAGISLEDQPVEAKRRMAFVADDPRFFTGLTVWEHVRFTAALYRVPHFETKAKKLLEMFSLIEETDAISGNLSLGMRHKAGLCCALLHDPDVLMLDEPLTGLDPRGILTLKEILKTRAAAGKAVILSSHLLNLVEDLCTHVLILNRGRTLYTGTLREMRQQFQASESTTLEEVFLSVTEGDAAQIGKVETR